MTLSTKPASRSALARAIAQESGALEMCRAFPNDCDKSVQLDAQILAYSLVRDRVASGVIPFALSEMRDAVEQALDLERNDALKSKYARAC